MAIDLKQSWGDASSKVSSFKTINETKDSQKKLQKNVANSSKENKYTDFKKQLSDAKGGPKENIKQIKSETKNQLELLLDLFKESLPKQSNSQSLSTVSGFFITAANETKTEIGNILTKLILSTIGCSEEQDYDSSLNQPLYIKVNQVDLFSQLKTPVDDEVGKFLYEKDQTQNGTLPFSMNRQLYQRLQTPNQSFSQDTSAGNGQTYKGASSSELFDIEYVQNYTDPSGTLVTGDFYKVTLNPQSTNQTKVSDFLFDYYTSIDIMSLDLLTANLKNMLTGSIDFGLKKSDDELNDQNNFLLILKRIMGICSDPTKKIDVSGNAKLSDLDDINDGFFEVTRQEKILSEKITQNTQSGVVEFEDCGNVKLPINVKSLIISQDEIINEVSDTKKVDLFKKYIDDLTKDPRWNLSGLQIKSSLDTSIITKIPTVIFKTVLSPKVMLGFLIMIKGIKNKIGEELDNKYDDLSGFLKTFKKFVVDFIREIFSIFVEKLFSIVKANIKQLVEEILLDIIKESKIKQVRIYSTIIYILSVIGQSVVDFRNCKSVIDEIQKLLNLALGTRAPSLSPFILASSALLSGVSDTRSMSNIVENLQKAGLPTGAAPDGGPNLMNIAMSSMIQGQNKEMAENGKAQIFIPPLTVTPAGLTLPTVGNGKAF